MSLDNRFPFGLNFGQRFFCFHFQCSNFLLEIFNLVFRLFDVGFGFGRHAPLGHGGGNTAPPLAEQTEQCFGMGGRFFHFALFVIGFIFGQFTLFPLQFVSSASIFFSNWAPLFCFDFGASLAALGTLFGKFFSDHVGPTVNFECLRWL